MKRPESNRHAALRGPSFGNERLKTTQILEAPVRCTKASVSRQPHLVPESSKRQKPLYLLTIIYLQERALDYLKVREQQIENIFGKDFGGLQGKNEPLGKKGQSANPRTFKQVLPIILELRILSEKTIVSPIIVIIMPSRVIIRCDIDLIPKSSSKYRHTFTISERPGAAFHIIKDRPFVQPVSCDLDDPAFLLSFSEFYVLDSSVHVEPKVMIAAQVHSVMLVELVCLSSLSPEISKSRWNKSYAPALYFGTLGLPVPRDTRQSTGRPEELP